MRGTTADLLVYNVSVESVLAFLAGCAWHYVPFLAFPIVCWIYERRRILEQIQENQAGRFCRHHNNPSRCVPCAAEFFSQGVAGDGFAAIPSGKAAVDVDELEDDLVDQLPASIRSKIPLTIRIPDQGSNHRPEISIEFWTSAAWPGAPLKLGYMTSQRIGDITVLIPPSVYCYRIPLTQQVGHDLRSIVLPDTYGIDRIALQINGYSVIDATPDTLFAAQHLVYGGKA